MSNEVRRFGLIGFPISQSFSPGYFSAKFEKEGLTNCRYDAYPLPSIDQLPKLLDGVLELEGLNVTIPYKEQVMKFLSEISVDARKIGAVNVIKFNGDKLMGFNTDCDAFFETTEKWFHSPENSQALILGTGGSSKAAQVALMKLNVPFKIVSREKGKTDFAYEELSKEILQKFNLIVNTTPLGMSPNTNAFPALDYDALGPDHFVYDLIYNPARTMFLQKAEMRGCTIKNGLEMLHVQADKAWKIWNR